MSRNKRGTGADDIYDEFRGDRFKNNPAVNREAMIERMYIRKLSSLGANRFHWFGFPDSVDVRFLELTELYFALSVFYFDTDYDCFFALRGGGYNYMNMLNNPTAFTVVGNNFVGKTISAVRDSPKVGARKAIPIWANYMRTPDLDVINIFATRLANIERTIEINSKNARQPKVIKTTENQKLSMVNLVRQFDEGQSVLQVNGAAIDDLDAISVLDLEANPDTIEKLNVARNHQWNNAMTLLGIGNANQDKKERLVSDEVSSNDDQTTMFRYEALNARRIAAEQINKYYGLDITVEYNTEVERQANEAREAALEAESKETEAVE